MKRWMIAFAVTVMICSGILFGVIICSFTETEELDMAAANELSYQCAAQWQQLISGDISRMPSSVFRYSVLDNQGKNLYTSEDGISTTYYEALRHKDSILDIKGEDQLLGKLILNNEHSERLELSKKRFLFLIFVETVVFILLFLSYMRYLNKIIFKPFQKLEQFASRVAGGNLDLPLQMDKQNIFGAFTESFDIMREELKKAREQEHKANESKKELVAKLSHDIKTPVASIKAVAELMGVKAKDENEKQKLFIIETKANQIDALISNLFHATLEELKELKVEAIEKSSLLLLAMIKTADYENRAQLGKIPECLLFFDELRLLQVFDNIFINSYKYADTKITVSFELEMDSLALYFRDYGEGVKEEELPLLTNKFFRGENTKGRSGSGLGLYISSYLISQMGGSMECKNLEDGFCVTVWLRI